MLKDKTGKKPINTHLKQGVRNILNETLSCKEDIILW
jgi:hypothetical protein